MLICFVSGIHLELTVFVSEVVTEAQLEEDRGGAVNQSEGPVLNENLDQMQKKELL